MTAGQKRAMELNFKNKRALTYIRSELFIIWLVSVAGVASAAVVAAGVSFTVVVVMVITFDVRVILKRAGDEGVDCCVGTALNTAVEFNAGLPSLCLKSAARKRQIFPNSRILIIPPSIGLAGFWHIISGTRANPLLPSAEKYHFRI